MFELLPQLAAWLALAGQPLDRMEQIERAAQIAADMTVQILVSDFDGRRWTRKTGAGTIINREGVVVTCSHVLGDHHRVRVRRIDGKTFDAVVLGRFPEHDLAVLKIKPPEGLEPAQGIPEGLAAAGTTAICIGFPKGARDQCIAEVGDYVTGVETGLVHASTPILVFKGRIAPGFSGGPLMDLDGRLLGVVIAMSKVQPQLGVAVPASVVLKDLERVEDFSAAR